MHNLLPLISEKSSELVRLVSPTKAANVAEAVLRASLTGLERVLLSGSGRSFTQEDGEALEEDLQALIDLFSLNLNNCCGCQLSFDMVENVAARQRSIVSLFSKPVGELVVLYHVAVDAAEQQEQEKEQEEADEPAAAEEDENVEEEPSVVEAAPSLNPFGDAPPAAPAATISTNPFGDAPSTNPFGPSSNPFDHAIVTDAAPAAAAAPVPAIEEEEPLPEKSPTDLLRVLMRRAEPSAKEFVRSLKQAEEPVRRSSIAALLPNAPSNGQGGAGAKGGGLFGKLTKQATAAAQAASKAMKKKGGGGMGGEAEYNSQFASI